jgi:hypothetical protein
MGDEARRKYKGYGVVGRLAVEAWCVDGCQGLRVWTIVGSRFWNGAAQAARRGPLTRGCMLGRAHWTETPQERHVTCPVCTRQPRLHQSTAPAAPFLSCSPLLHGVPRSVAHMLLVATTTLTYSVRPHPPQVLKNAVRATVERHTAGGRAPSPRLPPVLVRVCAGRDALCLRISDAGGGIPQEHLSSVRRLRPTQPVLGVDKFWRMGNGARAISADVVSTCPTARH